MKNYIWAVVAIVAVSMLAAVCIVVLRPDTDVVIVLTIFIGFLPTTIASVFSAMKSQETHALVNSRMTEALADAARAAYGEGVADGRAKANARTDMLATKAAEK